MELTCLLTDCDSSSLDLSLYLESGLGLNQRRSRLGAVPWDVKSIKLGGFRGWRDRIMIPVSLTGVLSSLLELGWQDVSIRLRNDPPAVFAEEPASSGA